MPTIPEHHSGAASTSSSSTTPNKRRRHNPSKIMGSEGDKLKNGKRGRPRVDPQDHNAVERRRTQIRLAQRTYRERKETTISRLESCVAEQQRTISEMNQVFMDFKNRALSCGIPSIHPVIGEDLKMATERFIKLSHRDEHGLNTENCPDEPQSTTNNTGTVLGSPGVEESRSWSLPHSVSQSTDVSTTTTVWGYQVSVESTSKPHNNDAEHFELDSRQDYSSNGLDPKLQGNIIYNPRGRTGIPESFIYTSTWNAEADRSLTSDYTYSFQESTFARRLLRSSYERAYRLLMSPDANKHMICQAFRYTLCFGKTEHIKARIDQTLSRTKQDSLEQWDFPNLHVGGAGLHYPRLSMDGEATPPATWANSHSTRPFLRRPSTIPVRDEDFPHRVAELANVEGEWLDSNDVEQYLKDKGLHLDGHSSIAEIEVDDPVPGLVSDFVATSPQSPSSGHLTTPQSPRNTSESYPRSQPHTGDYFSDRNTENITHFPAQLAPNPSMDFALASSWLNDSLDQTGDGVNFMDADAMFPDMVPIAQWPRKRKLVIDVDKLMTVLNEHAVCLGRAPGYKQADVDDALNTVMQDAS